MWLKGKEELRKEERDKIRGLSPDELTRSPKYVRDRERKKRMMKK